MLELSISILCVVSLALVPICVDFIKSIAKGPEKQTLNNLNANIDVDLRSEVSKLESDGYAVSKDGVNFKYSSFDGVQFHYYASKPYDVSLNTESLVFIPVIDNEYNDIMGKNNEKGKKIVIMDEYRKEKRLVS